MSCSPCNAISRRRCDKMKNLPKEKRDRLILIVIGTVICVAALYYVVIQSQKKTRDKIEKAILEEKNKVENAQRLISSTAEIQKKLEGSVHDLKGIEESMASGDMY